jgi:hypothetical protein
LVASRRLDASPLSTPLLLPSRSCIPQPRGDVTKEKKVALLVNPSARPKEGGGALGRSRRHQWSLPPRAAPATRARRVTRAEPICISAAHAEPQLLQLSVPTDRYGSPAQLRPPLGPRFPGRSPRASSHASRTRSRPRVAGRDGSQDGGFCRRTPRPRARRTRRHARATGQNTRRGRRPTPAGAGALPSRSRPQPAIPVCVSVPVCLVFSCRRSRGRVSMHLFGSRRRLQLACSPGVTLR